MFLLPIIIIGCAALCLALFGSLFAGATDL
jgi:hypothetical protein